MQAVVEYVLSGHRLKVHVPKEGVSIAFAPSGIKTPARAQPASNGRPAVVGEPYADEALTFTREHFMQVGVCGAGLTCYCQSVPAPAEWYHTCAVLMWASGTLKCSG